jgi:hypothetical protein
MDDKKQCQEFDDDQRSNRSRKEADRDQQTTNRFVEHADEGEQ